jgi:hypothetical protein
MIFYVAICSKINRFFKLVVIKKKSMNIRQQAQILLARRYQRSKHRSRSISSRLAAKIGCPFSSDGAPQTEFKQIM